MTYNQLMFWQNVETRRKNITDEYINYLNYKRSRDELAEKVRHDKEGENIDWSRVKVSQGELAERERSNRVGESISWFNAQEGARHNLQDESIKWYNAKEGARHNSALEGIQWFQAYEQQRANQANEYLRRDELNERIRNDLVNESISQQRADTYQFEADTSRQRADTYQFEADTSRTHLEKQDAYTAAHYLKQDSVARQRLDLDTWVSEYKKGLEERETAVTEKKAETERFNAETKRSELQRGLTLDQANLWFGVADKLSGSVSDGLDRFFGVLKSGGGNAMSWSNYLGGK